MINVDIQLIRHPRLYLLTITTILAMKATFTGPAATATMARDADVPRATGMFFLSFLFLLLY
jgi:hypothetical protein